MTSTDSGAESKSLLDADALDYLRIGGSEIELPSGDAIIRKGDPGSAVFIILSGEVEVSLHTADGRRLALSRLGSGEIFGELSVLRGVPASADVTALCPVRLLRYPAERFPTALAECEPLRNRLLDRLAQNLHHTTTDAWSLFKREQAFTDLVRAEGIEYSMVVASARMRAIKTRLEKLGKKRKSVLITGEAGTGRTLAARLVHRSSGRGDEALIVVDCNELPTNGAHSAIFGLFKGTDFKEGSGCFGALHLAHGGNLILRNLDALPAQEQEQLASYMRERRTGPDRTFPDARIIATTLELGSSSFHTRELNQSLRAEFEETVNLPRLSDRPRDIVPLARHFLAETEGVNQPNLTKSAEHALVSLRCPVRNVDELRNVVEMAARCSGGSEIRADHIFSGLGEEEPFGLELGQPRFVKWLVQGTGLRFLRATTLVGFLAAIWLCISAGTSVAGRFANGFIWSVWEPFVFASFFLAGALWCTICPLSTAGRLAKRIAHIKRPPPPWLGRSFAVAIPVVGFLVILWAEWFFHMTEAPVGSGFLLLALILSSVLLCIVFEREVWCRYICPLGRLAVILAPAAPLSIAADRKICASSCTTHECFKGTDSVPGCTVFHHPLNTVEAQNCKLCGDCLVSCPHGSTGLFLRPPLQGGWRLTEGSSYPGAFAIALLLLVPVFLAGQTSDFVAQRPSFVTVGGIVAVVIGLILGWNLPRLLGKRTPNVAAAPRVAAALAVLAWGPLMAIQFGNIVFLKNLRLQATDSSLWLARLFNDISLLSLASIAVILVAGFAAAIILQRARLNCRKELLPIAPMAWEVLMGVWVVYIALSLTLVL